MSTITQPACHKCGGYPGNPKAMLDRVKLFQCESCKTYTCINHTVGILQLACPKCKGVKLRVVAERSSGKIPEREKKEAEVKQKQRSTTASDGRKLGGLGGSSAGGMDSTAQRVLGGFDGDSKTASFAKEQLEKVKASLQSVTVQASQAKDSDDLKTKQNEQSKGNLAGAQNSAGKDVPANNSNISAQDAHGETSSTAPILADICHKLRNQQDLDSFIDSWQNLPSNDAYQQITWLLPQTMDILEGCADIPNTQLVLTPQLLELIDHEKIKPIAIAAKPEELQMVSVEHENVSLVFDVTKQAGALSDDILALLKPWARVIALIGGQTAVEAVEQLKGANALFAITPKALYGENEALTEALRNIPLDRLLLASESRLIAPPQHAGQFYEPSMLPEQLSALYTLLDLESRKLREVDLLEQMAKIYASITDL